jgi:hypothetical protein
MRFIAPDNGLIFGSNLCRPMGASSLQASTLRMTRVSWKVRPTLVWMQRKTSYEHSTVSGGENGSGDS